MAAPRIPATNNGPTEGVGAPPPHTACKSIKADLKFFGSSYDGRGCSFVEHTLDDGMQIKETILEPGLALLWQIYSRRCLSAICLLQYWHRCGRGRTMSSTMAWRTAGRLG